jgi:hypothetical protein
MKTKLVESRLLFNRIVESDFTIVLLNRSNKKITTDVDLPHAVCISNTNRFGDFGQRGFWKYVVERNSTNASGRMDCRNFVILVRGVSCQE